VSAIGSAIGAVTDRLRSIASRVAVDPLVDLVRPSVGFFLGDVFAYLNDGDLQADIRSEIQEKLLAAHSSKGAGEKLVVIGHSLGGVILVDMLSSPLESGLPEDFRVDALLTVGSQPGLFQALGLIVEPEDDKKTPRPPGVAAWFNVFDPLDPLAFRCEPIFADVKDMRFDSITGVASAHTTYFKRPQFYARARRRLREIGTIA
jgi:pimeloyl-ACP methyl ester carboxylesterase